MRVCADESFASNPALSLCSGFLVGPNLLVTAGHCIKNENDCANARFVFDYKNDLTVGGGTAYFLPENVYGCQKIIRREYQGPDSVGKLDFALIKLNRSVHDRLPLRYRKMGKIEDNASLMIIGYPSGLPAIIADNATVRSNLPENYFITNLDSFGGNSGSPVFNVATGEVEGLLVRGEKDYAWDSKAGCNRPIKCAMDNCRGEDVTRITTITELMGLAGYAL